jgi:hypothetical protein
MIYCNDKNIKECYVGGTNDLKARIRHHKHSCNNKNSKEYNKPLYHFIRANGGFNNWSVDILEHYPCNSKQELLDQEDYWILQFSNLLNCRRAKRSLKQYYKDNEDKIKQYHQQYYIDNADKFKQHFNCDCGGKYTQNHKAGHLKTKLHQNYINNII